jgi:hypothetical protein
MVSQLEWTFSGDAVTFLAEPSPTDCPTKWLAKQVSIFASTFRPKRFRTDHQNSDKF